MSVCPPAHLELRCLEVLAQGFCEQWEDLGSVLLNGGSGVAVEIFDSADGQLSPEPRQHGAETRVSGSC